jgi:hypothetical protein
MIVQLSARSIGPELELLEKSKPRSGYFSDLALAATSGDERTQESLH